RRAKAGLPREWISRRGIPMKTFPAIIVAEVALCTLCITGASAQSENIPQFAPDNITSWTLERPAQDDFLPPPSGQGPVTSEPGHPYIPNGAGKQQTNRIADLTNPILKPWVIEQMQKPNDEVRAGKIGRAHV